MSLRNKLLILAFVLLLVDQVLKIWVKTHMVLGQEYNILGDWFRIHFLENNGMAFGMGANNGKIGKIILTVLRIVAVYAIGWYICKLLKEKAPLGVLICFVLIFCGALGNIFDSMFYGILFGSSEGQLATFLPEGGGYASFLQGRVVDMFYFPLFRGYLPDWVPFWGGQYFEFFRPVFNLADAYISVAVILLILFYRKFFTKKE